MTRHQQAWLNAGKRDGLAGQPPQSLVRRDTAKAKAYATGYALGNAARQRQ
jgi:hypothetical protein